MLPIVTDVERVHHHSAPRSPRSARVLQRVGIPALTVVSVLTSTVFVATRPAAGDAISDAKAKAAAIEAQLTTAQNQMSALSQQYDQAQYQLSQINSSIATTKANVAANQAEVAKDKATLSKAAVANYISDGTAAAQNPIFSGNEKSLGATTTYNQIAEGDISLAVANLHTARERAERTAEPTARRAGASPDAGGSRAAGRRAERAGHSVAEECTLPGAGTDRRPRASNSRWPRPLPPPRRHRLGKLLLRLPPEPRQRRRPQHRRTPPVAPPPPS